MLSTDCAVAESSVWTSDEGTNCEFIASSESRTNQEVIVKRLKGAAPCDFSIVYVTAESLTMDSFLGTLFRMYKRGRLGLVTIDVAHWISRWEHDFSKVYSGLGIIENRFTNIPIEAFTATATKTVQNCGEFFSDTFNSNSTYSAYFEMNRINQVDMRTENTLCLALTTGKFVLDSLCKP